MIVMAVSFIPFLFYSSDSISRLFAMINAGIIGFGISGIMFYFDILMGYVIDEDEAKTGVKRSASFYGTNAFVHRFSIILFISSVYLVFSISIYRMADQFCSHWGYRCYNWVTTIIICFSRGCLYLGFNPDVFLPFREKIRRLRYNYYHPFFFH
jgi:Na+/melibiose symporter-like transporter